MFSSYRTLFFYLIGSTVFTYAPKPILKGTGELSLLAIYRLDFVVILDHLIKEFQLYT